MILWLYFNAFNFENILYFIIKKQKLYNHTNKKANGLNGKLHSLIVPAHGQTK